MGLLPLALGLLATNIGQRDIDKAQIMMIETESQMSDEEIASAKELAMGTTYLGIAATALLLVIAGLGIARSSNRSYE